MNNRLLTLSFLTIALLLTGCKTTPPGSSDSSESEIPTESTGKSATSGSTPSSESSVNSELATSSDSSSCSSSEGTLPLIGWPTEIIADYLDSFGLEVNVPSLDLDREVIVEYLNDDEYRLGFGYIRLRIENENIVKEFSDVLTFAGFSVQPSPDYIEEYYAYDASWTKLMIHYFYEGEDHDSIINITALTDNSNQAIPPSNPDKNALFDFSTAEQIVGGKNTDMTTWQANSSTFIVTKMENGIGVGNPSPGNEYYENPLRLYPGQTVTITAGESELIEQVKFDVQNVDEAKGKDSLETLTNALPNNATFYINGDSITYVFAAPVTSFSFQIEQTTGVQARLFKATLYFV